jgi:ArsR family transcriptional regulator
MTMPRADWPPTSAEEEAQTLDAAVRALQFLGDHNRLRILKLLAQREMSVSVLVDQLALPQPLVSYHLRRLREAGLVQVRRQAKQVHYSIDPSAWEGFTRPIREVCDVVTMPIGGTAEFTNTRPP